MTVAPPLPRGRGGRGPTGHETDPKEVRTMLARIDRAIYVLLYATPPRRQLTRARRRAIVTYTLPRGGTP